MLDAVMRAFQHAALGTFVVEVLNRPYPAFRCCQLAEQVEYRIPQRGIKVFERDRMV